MRTVASFNSEVTLPTNLTPLADMDRETWLIKAFGSNRLRIVVGRHKAIAKAKVLLGQGLAGGVTKMVDTRTRQLLEGLPVAIGSIIEWHEGDAMVSGTRVMGESDPGF